MTNSNRPIYRYPPKSHAWNCPCPRCAQCRRDRKQAGVVANYGIIGPGLLVAGLVAVVGFWPAMVWHGYTDTGGWRWDIHSTIGCSIWWALTLGPFLAAAVIDVSKGRLLRKPPAGRLRVEATQRPAVPPAMPSPGTPPRPRKLAPASGPPMSSLPFPPVSLTCQHLGAVRVENLLDPKVAWHCWCPDCDPEGRAPLPANFTRPCCGTPPGRLPGEGHAYNCPQAARG